MTNNRLKDIGRSVSQKGLASKIRDYQNVKFGTPKKNVLFKDLINTFIQSYQKIAHKLS